MRFPSPAPVASNIRVLEKSIDAFDFFAITAGMMIIAPKKIGPNTVAKMNHLVRTRSRYSRLTIAQSLAMSVNSRLDACCSNFLEEDLVKRRTHDLKPIDRRASAYYAMQQRLRISTIRELDLEVPIGIIDSL